MKRTLHFLAAAALLVGFITFGQLDAAKQTVNVGTTANDGTGDTPRTAFTKTNENFTELYDFMDASSAATATKLGTGAPLITKSGTSFTTLSISTVGDNITVSTTGGTIRINASAALADINGAQTLGTGAAVFRSESAGVLSFAGIEAGDRMIVGTSATGVTLNPLRQFPADAWISTGDSGGGGNGQLYGQGSTGRWFVNLATSTASADFTGATGVLNVNGGVHTNVGSAGTVALGLRSNAGTANDGLFFGVAGQTYVATNGTKAATVDIFGGSGYLQVHAQASDTTLAQLLATTSISGIGNGSALQTSGLGVGLGSNSGTYWLTTSSAATTLGAAARLIVPLAVTPSSASDTGTAGTIAWDSNYIYVCVATNTWKRVAISTW